MNDLPYIWSSDSIFKPYAFHGSDSIRVISAYFQNILFGKFFAQLLTFWNGSESIKPIGLFNGIFYCPSSGNSISENEIAHPNFCCEVHHGHCFPLVCEQAIAASIIGLLFPSCPSAIRFAVVAVIVFSIQGVCARRFVSHVDHEAHKSTHSILSFFPSSTDFYSSTSIVWIFNEVFVSASRQHHSPLAICRMVAKFRLVVGRKLQNVFSGLAHVMNGLSSSAGSPASTDDRRAFFMPFV